MHSQLEHYLSEVAAQLGPMPLVRRNEELEEMRQHLLTAITAQQEYGQPDEQAVASALQQFGEAQEVGESIVWAWLRADQVKRRWYFWGLAVIAISVCALWGNASPAGARGMIVFEVPVALVMLAQRFWTPKYKSSTGAYWVQPLGVLPCLLLTLSAPFFSLLNSGGHLNLLNAECFVSMSLFVWIGQFVDWRLTKYRATDKIEE